MGTIPMEPLAVYASPLRSQPCKTSLVSAQKASSLEFEKSLNSFFLLSALICFIL